MLTLSFFDIAALKWQSCQLSYEGNWDTCTSESAMIQERFMAHFVFNSLRSISWKLSEYIIRSAVLLSKAQTTVCITESAFTIKLKDR